MRLLQKKLIVGGDHLRNIPIFYKEYSKCLYWYCH